MKNYYKVPFTIYILILPLFSFAQWEDCSSSKFISGGVTSLPASFGTGNIDDLANYVGCMVDGEHRSTWIKFEIDSHGFLLFDIIADYSVSDDFDFALFRTRDTLGSNYCCEAIASGLLESVRCNFSSSLSIPRPIDDTIGLRQGYVNVNSNPTGPKFSAPLEVFKGEQYVLLVDRFSFSGGGFLIDFTPSTAKFLDSLSYFNNQVINDTISPEILSSFAKLSLDSNCQRKDTFTVVFSEAIPCTSLSPQNINITGPDSIIITDVIPGSCSCNASHYFELVLDENYPPADSAEYFISASYSDPYGNQGDSLQSVSFYSRKRDKCSLTAPTGTDCSCVWPGDINNDGIANNYDVLSLGIGYGHSGPVRQNASINWEAQASENWDSLLISPSVFRISDLKHADCNGDGLVDFNDTSAISQNYNLTHNKSSQSGAQNFIPLLVQLPDTVFVDDTVYAAIMLGNPSLFLDSLYGIAFSLTYDSTFLGSPLQTYFEASLFSNLGQNHLGFSKNLPSGNQTDVAITRTDLQNSVGQLYGQIGTVVFVLDPDLYNKTTPKKFIVHPSNILAIDNKGNVLNVGGTPDSTVVIDPYLNTSSFDFNQLVQLYPNPTENQITIDAGQENIQRLIVTDISGKQLMDIQNLNTQKHQLSLDLEAGVYLVQVYTTKGIVTKKMLMR